MRPFEKPVRDDAGDSVADRVIPGEAADADEVAEWLAIHFDVEGVVGRCQSAAPPALRSMPQPSIVMRHAGSVTLSRTVHGRVPVLRCRRCCKESAVRRLTDAQEVGVPGLVQDRFRGARVAGQRGCRGTVWTAHPRRPDQAGDGPVACP